MQTFLFYDIETSGLNPAFDQVLTFAGIRTDLDLNEIERETITVQLRRDIVPSPRAFLTHGLTYDELANGISEYDAARKIHALVNTPGTISLGYNSLGFDDEFLRFLFYRNLLDPYVHQYGNGCSRMDLLPITVVLRVFHPDGVIWPTIDGKPSLKLELISRENQFVTSGRAHEAMSDVEALIGLTKKLIQKKDIWNYCFDFFNKTRDEVRINTIETVCDILSDKYQLCLMVSAAFGPDANYLAPVIHIGQSIAYKNQNLWLRLDSDDILGLETKAQFKDTYIIRKRYGDTPIVLPAIERFWMKLSEPSKESIARNLKIIGSHGPRFKEFIAYHRAYKYPRVPNIDSDAALYQDGFFSSREKKESHLFHQAGNDEKSLILEQIKSPRIQQLAHRILMRNFNDRADLTYRAEYDQYIKRLVSDKKSDHFMGYKGDVKYNCMQGLKELKELKIELSNPNHEQTKMLEWLYVYIKNKF
ncbi:MAG: exonuclease domain-containing protein [Pseudomonadota bacterium]